MTPTLQMKLVKILAWCDGIVDADTGMEDLSEILNEPVAYGDPELLAALLDDPEVKEWYENKVKDVMITGELH